MKNCLCSSFLSLRAFASYVENAGGCNYIQDIVCDATNMQVIKAYANDPKYKKALDCLVNRCGLVEGIDFAAINEEH